MRFNQSGVHVIQRIHQFLSGEFGMSYRNEFVSVQNENGGEDESEDDGEEGGVFDEGPDVAPFVVFGVGGFFEAAHYF